MNVWKITFQPTLNRIIYESVYVKTGAKKLLKKVAR